MRYRDRDGKEATYVTACPSWIAQHKPLSQDIPRDSSGKPGLGSPSCPFVQPVVTTRKYSEL